MKGPFITPFSPSIRAPAMYNVISYPTMEQFAERLQKEHPGLFTRIPVKWSKFSDSGMDHIIVDGFRPTNIIKRSRVIFLADFNSNDAIMEKAAHSVMQYDEYFTDSDKEEEEREARVARACHASASRGHLC